MSSLSQNDAQFVKYCATWRYVDMLRRRRHWVRLFCVCEFCIKHNVCALHFKYVLHKFYFERLLGRSVLKQDVGICQARHHWWLDFVGRCKYTVAFEKFVNCCRLTLICDVCVFGRIKRTHIYIYIYIIGCGEDRWPTIWLLCNLMSCSLLCVFNRF